VVAEYLTGQVLYPALRDLAHSQCATFDGKYGGRVLIGTPTASFLPGYTKEVSIPLFRPGTAPKALWRRCELWLMSTVMKTQAPNWDPGVTTLLIDWQGTHHNTRPRIPGDGVG